MERSSGSPEVMIGLIDGPVVTQHADLVGEHDSRPVPVQEVEQNPLRVPFEISAPEGDRISLSRSAKFALKIKRDSRATRSLLVEWTAEVALDGGGYRVAGAGKEGTLSIPPSVANVYPAVVSLRVLVLNANGKAYTLDKVYRLVQ